MLRDKNETLCPHCEDLLKPAALPESTLVQCCGCGFIYPAVHEESHDPIHRDIALIPGDRYRLIKPLHAWGEGRVYLARHLILDEPCVVKILSTIDPGFCEESLARFTAEAKAGFRIQHPHVARVLDCDHVGDQWYFVMEYVEGTNLRDVVQTCTRLSWAQAAEIGIQAANGLKAIHQAGLCHRDLKPSNLILCRDGSIKIADLGLASFARPHEEKSPTLGLGRGTPRYMSPEQRRGDPHVDERTDIYALGATIYHLLAGNAPSHGHDLGPLGYLTDGDAHAPIDWPRSTVPPIPVWLRQIVETALSPDPAQRFESAEAMGREIAKWLQPRERSGGMFSLPGIGTPRAAVVMPFQNLSGDGEVDWLSNALAEEIHGSLLTVENLQVADRHELMQLLGRLFGEQAAEATQSHLLEAARRVGAATVIRGVFQREGDRVIVTASRLRSDQPSGELLTRVRGSMNDLIGLQRRVARKVVEALGLSLGGKAKLNSNQTASPETLRRYAAAQTAFTSGQYALAVEHCRAALEEDSDRSELLSLMGVCHSRLGEYDQAIACHKRLEAIAQEQQNPHALVEATGNLGVMYYLKGEFPLAYELMRRSGELASQLNLLPLLATTCSNIGFVLTKMERLVEADQAFEEAIRIKLSLGATAALIAPYNGRGAIALRQGRYPDALNYYRQAMEWATQIADRVNLGVCHTNMGRTYLQMNQYEEAAEHLNQALGHLTATEFRNGLATAYEHLADLHLQRKEPAMTLKYADQRIDLARRHANRHMEASAWEQKARAYEQMSRKDEAMDCLRKSFELQQTKSPYEALPAEPPLPKKRS